MVIVKGGLTVYGHDIGILMLDTTCPRPPGDVGNALTWPFPVLYKVVEGADTSRIMGSEPDPTLLDPFIEGARELEAKGVRAITTSCGFLSVFHRAMQASVGVPMLTSALLQVPLAARLVGPGRKVGILTERPHLTGRHFIGMGWKPGEVDTVVTSMPRDAVFPQVYIDQTVVADAAVLEAELEALARRQVEEHPDVGAIVLECTNFVPWGKAMRRATGLPIFDLYSLVTSTHQSLLGRTFGTS
ncbi:MAG: aspartate/glutamate racemase family protein [bacterium]|nr:aspartate/glutamate racemase family protein [bacterium]MDE0437825.1 aspartate/glutamate racemase family protein [bacterium]